MSLFLRIIDAADAAAARQQARADFERAASSAGYVVPAEYLDRWYA
jgi:hypothetical protein